MYLLYNHSKLGKKLKIKWDLWTDEKFLQKSFKIFAIYNKLSLNSHLGIMYGFSQSKYLFPTFNLS